MTLYLVFLSLIKGICFLEDSSKIIHSLVSPYNKSIEFSLSMNFTVPNGTRVPSKLDAWGKKRHSKARKPTPIKVSRYGVHFYVAARFYIF